MKKLIVLLSSIAFAMSTATAQMSISPEAGVNFASVKGDNGDEHSILPGLKLGFNVNIPIADNLYLSPGAFFNYKGYQNNYSTSSTLSGATTTIKNDFKVSMQYIEVPVNLMYRYALRNGALMFNVGPYVAYAVGGKKVGKTTISSTATTFDIVNNYDDKVEFGTESGETNAFDYGVNAGVGYEFPMGLYIRGQYGYGIANLSNATNIRQNNSNIQLSVGYNIWTWAR